MWRSAVLSVGHTARGGGVTVCAGALSNKRWHPLKTWPSPVLCTMATRRHSSSQVFTELTLSTKAYLRQGYAPSGLRDVVKTAHPYGWVAAGSHNMATFKVTSLEMNSYHPSSCLENAIMTKLALCLDQNLFCKDLHLYTLLNTCINKYLEV